MDVMKAMDRPMVEWEQMYDELSPHARGDLAGDAAALAIRAARLSRYVAWRATGENHGRAVGAQNVTAGNVRIALGFTQRRDDIYF